MRINNHPFSLCHPIYLSYFHHLQVSSNKYVDSHGITHPPLQKIQPNVKQSLSTTPSAPVAKKMSCCKALLCSTSIYDSIRLPKLHIQRPPRLQIRCSNSSPDTPSITEKLEYDGAMTGSAYDFNRGTISLTRKLLSTPKKVTLVRHGLSTWNEESKIQGSSNLSVLTEDGVRQAERCRNALANIYFDKCFSSPISRAKSTAQVMWQGREEPLVFLDSLKEAHLFFLEGMKNVDARRVYPKEYITWREDPAKFHVNGVYPLRRIWATASEAWREILDTPGEDFLVITHKSILRALICTALGLSPERFRAIDINNGGITVFKFNTRGEAMLQSLNMTAHMYSNHIYLN